MSKETMKLALEGAANYIDALGGDSRKYWQALAEQPAQRKPLTDEQIEPIAIDVLGYGALCKEDMKLFTQTVRAIEVAHGIKGDA